MYFILKINRQNVFPSFVYQKDLATMTNPEGRSMTSSQIVVLKSNSDFGAQKYKLSSRYLVIPDVKRTQEPT